MLQQQKDIVKATIPALQQHGEAITGVFYKTLFEEHPALLNVFNPANQQNGGQARSLAASILAYASHIDKLDQLGGMVSRIGHKHASLEVQPEHYPIVGDHLLRAIRSVLGEAATPEILDAWGSRLSAARHHHDRPRAEALCRWPFTARRMGRLSATHRHSQGPGERDHHIIPPCIADRAASSPISSRSVPRSACAWGRRSLPADPSVQPLRHQRWTHLPHQRQA